MYEGKSITAIAVIYEVTWRWASRIGKSNGCDFKLEGGISLKCGDRELKSQADLLILVFRFLVTYANTFCKDALGSELKAPNPP